ncbi:hypothetical protein UPYG_G00075800 [Umbra pygmaea]|uniref:Cyclic nucleotide-binding domain-containing protein n=1 Tax=Umbra pygmaea TaxID=75934 RepID=A0ABD0XCX3_UMBPY
MSLQLSSLQLTDCQKVLGVDYTNLKALCRINGLKLSDSNSYQSTEEAHKHFMNSYQKIFLRPQNLVIKKDSKIRDKLQASKSQVFQDMNRNQGHKRQTQETHMNYVIKALKKIPILRSQLEHRDIHKMLKVFPCLTAQLSRLELQQISTIAIVETWDRAQIIFGHNGFYLILKGSVRLYSQETSNKAVDPKGPVLGVGASFGSFEPPSPTGTEVDLTAQCTLTQEPCEILQISHSGYARLKKEIQAHIYVLKETLIQGCQFYLQWPKFSIHRLADLIQMKRFPPNHVLVKEGKVSPFAAYIRKGECHMLQDIHFLKKTPQETKGSRVKFIVVGKLGPMESFGEVSILLNRPSPCSIVTATEIQVGIIQPDALKGLDSVTLSLMLQTAQPTYGNLSQDEMNLEYVRQGSLKEWDHVKKKVLSEALFYNGIQEGHRLTREGLSFCLE